MALSRSELRRNDRRAPRCSRLVLTRPRSPDFDPGKRLEGPYRARWNVLRAAPPAASLLEARAWRISALSWGVTLRLADYSKASGISNGFDRALTPDRRRAKGATLRSACSHASNAAPAVMTIAAPISTRAVGTSANMR